ncbi:MAG: recombinase family protein [Phycisphaerae bacterium]|jgi:DNA invertase Pin-like site-specific DNA recombinase
MAQGKFIAYLRVSTDKQGKSGLGLEAQREAVMRYLNGGSWDLVNEFVEVESGKRDERPQLAAALAACRRHKATLVIAKLDRLSRRVSFISAVMDSGVDFIAVDQPHATRLTLHILAAVAEHEREMISARTKAALAAAKRRGRKLGWSIPSRRDEQAEAAAKGAAGNAGKADDFAKNIVPVIQAVRASGASSLAAVADALNARGIKTARGGRWYATTVRNVELRSAA